ncbi:MAG TPA: CDP-alcohol phosphatidyltransferase family protein [Rhizomicrobium sp.]|nr:CDP-alcohol phosphatidyltransferase family protein [Rhizomicrobium sp.]
MRYSMADVRASYDAEKAREEWYGDWMSAAVYRRISFFITVPLLNLSVTASQVTIVGLLMALALPVVALFAGPYAHLGVATLAIAFVVLDCVDGNIARVTHTASKSGHYLDFFTDIVFRITLYAAVGILADREVAGVLGGQGLALGLLAALLAIVARLSRVFTRQLSPGDVFDPAGEGAAPKGFIDGFLLPALSGLDRLLPILVLAAKWWGGLGWVVLWLVVYSAADLAYTQYAVFRRLAAPG